MSLEDRNRKRAQRGGEIEQHLGYVRKELFLGKAAADIEAELVRRGETEATAKAIVERASRTLFVKPPSLVGGIAMVAVGVASAAIGLILYENRQRHLQEAIEKLQSEGGGYYWDSPRAAAMIYGFFAATSLLCLIFGTTKILDARARSSPPTHR